VKHVLVTGASGFIGLHVLRALLVRDVRVTALTRRRTQLLSTFAAARAATNLTWSQRSIECLNQEAPLPPDSTIVHLAGNPKAKGSSPGLTVETELRRLAGVMELASQSDSSRIIYASSSRVYGNPLDFPITEDFPVSHNSAYSMAKLRAEAMLASAHIQTVALRVFNVYGPGQASGTVMGKICADAVSGSRSFIESNPDMEQPIDFVYVRDVAEVIAELATSGALPAQTLNLGSGCSVRPTSVAKEVLGNWSDPGCWDIPCGVGVGSSSRAALESVIGNQPVTPLTNGIAETVAWFRSQHSRGPGQP